MATTVYKIETITLMDGTDVEMSPLKIRYLRDFMEMFQFVKTATDDSNAMFFLTECAAIAMRQYNPEIATSYQLEELVDLGMLYKIVEIAGGIKIGKDTDDEETPVVEQVKESESGSWDNLDLVKLESEVFLLGIWKNYEELELTMSIPEILATLNIKRDLDYNDKRFNAGIQGVNLDEATGKDEENAWEAMKARVASKNSGIKAKDSNDITSFQGIKAQQVGFGIGMGIDYSTTL